MALYMNANDGIPGKHDIIFYKVIHYGYGAMPAEGNFPLGRKIPEGGMPFIRVDIDNLAYKTRKFMGICCIPSTDKAF